MNKYSTILITMMLVLSAIIYPVMASHTYITGTIKSGSTGLNDAKITAERVGEYKWDRTSSSGYYTLYTSTTNLYSVSASKTYYTRDTVNVSGGNTANLYLSSRSLTQVIFKIAYDPEGPKYITFQKAKDYLYSAEPWFKEEYGIDFADTGIGDSVSWDVTNLGSNDSCEYDYLPDLKNEANWYSGNYGIADVLIGFTDNVMSEQTTGCINYIPSNGGIHPYIAISATTPDMARTVMHEISHAYGLQHRGCSNQIPNVMSSGCSSSIYIKNWTPTDDHTMENRRGWY